MTLGSLFDGIGGFPLAAGVKHWLVAPLFVAIILLPLAYERMRKDEGD